MKPFIFIAQAAEAAPQGSLLMTMFPMILIFGVLYLLMVRPQKKKEKELREQLNAMQVGDKVITIGGLVGKIVNIQDDEVTIASSVSNTLLTFKKSAINNIIKQGESTAASSASSQKSSAQEIENSERPKGFLERIFNKPKSE